MRAFLLTWNPSKEWEGDPRRATKWSTGNRQGGIQKGDRLYLVRQGGNRGNRGVVGIGTASGPIGPGPHWRSGESTARFVAVEWSMLENVVSVDTLSREIPGVPWGDLYASGVIVENPSDAKKLERLVLRQKQDLP